jgi:hypothetical protein
MPKRLRGKLKQTEFYCVSCRDRVRLHPDDICVTNFRNKRMEGGTPALVGVCNECDVNVTKFIKHKDEDRLADKYGEC